GLHPGRGAPPARHADLGSEPDNDCPCPANHPLPPASSLCRATRIGGVARPPPLLGDMKTILAATWNALIDRLRREQVLGCTVMAHGGWKHPWQVTPSWSFEREEWVAQIHPGFVNGLDAEVRLRAEEAPPETLE